MSRLLLSRTSARVVLALATLACEPVPEPAPPAVDTAPPDTSIDEGPAPFVATAQVVFAFASSEPGARIPS